MPSRELDKLLNQSYNIAEQLVKEFERELAKTYKAAYVEIDNQLSKLYASMGDTPSLLEARRYGRLDNLMSAIKRQYRELTTKTIKETRNLSASVYAQGAYGTEWAYDQAIGTAIKWPVIPVEAIRASVWNSVAGEQFSERFRNWSTRDVITFQNRIAQSLAMGKGYSYTSKRIRETIEASAYQAMRIARTESTRNYTQGHLQVYDSLEDVGIKAKKQWVATLDTRTRDTHGILDGQYADEDGLFHIHGDSAEGPGLFSDPSESINCRCRVIEVIDGLAPEYRRIKGEGIVPYQTYEQWAKDKGWSPSTGWDLEAKARLAESQARKY